MGASQSAPNASSGSGTGSGTTTARTSYYDLLEVAATATEDEIKKAYRRKALELHPDRNFGDVERATQQFAEVQVAWEVLSDPQERAWGDGFAEGKMGFMSAGEVTGLFRRFNGNVAFDDSAAGFFGFLRGTFARLAAEEEAAVRREGGGEGPGYPDFGRKEDGYEDVVRPFYAAWNGFATRKSFAWRDKYRTSDAPDRRVRRLIEKENRLAREEGMREFNLAVRALIAFVKKRDPRFKPNTQSEEERQRDLREATAAQAARQRAANAAKMAEDVPEWVKSRDEEAEEHEAAFEDEESEEEQFECVVCRKTFKSEKQFEAHERSKKHVKAVQTLRRRLQKEGKTLGLDEDEDDDAEDEDDDSGDENHNGVENPIPLAEMADEDEPDPLNEELPEKNGETQNRTLGNTNHIDREEETLPTKNVEDLRIDSDTEQGTTDSDEELDKTRPPSRDDHVQGSEDEKISEPTKKMGKAAQKRAKKAAQTAASKGDPEQQFRCAQCSAGFPSKTRLFQHINDLGHAAPVQSTKAKSKASRKRK